MSDISEVYRLHYVEVGIEISINCLPVSDMSEVYGLHYVEVEIGISMAAIPVSDMSEGHGLHYVEDLVQHRVELWAVQQLFLLHHLILEQQYVL